MQHHASSTTTSNIEPVLEDPRPHSTEPTSQKLVDASTPIRLLWGTYTFTLHSPYAMPSKRKRRPSMRRSKRRKSDTATGGSRSAVEVGSCWEVYLRGLSSDNSETQSTSVNADKQAGYGIVQIISTSPLSGAWMQPTKQIPEFAEFASGDEYTCDERTTWALKLSDLTHAVDMLDIQTHALSLPLYSASMPSDIHGERRTLALGQKRRFTRTTISGDGKRSTSHTRCAKCTLALHAEQYVHCRRCDEVYHNDCTDAKMRQPFQIITGTICDNSGTSVVCPKCSGNAEANGNIFFQTAEHLGKVPSFILNVCIDIGSEKAKVSTKLYSSGAHR